MYIFIYIPSPYTPIYYVCIYIYIPSTYIIYLYRLYFTAISSIHLYTYTLCVHIRIYERPYMRPMCAIYVIVLYVCNICYSVICVQYMLLCLHIYLNTIYLHTSLPTLLLCYSTSSTILRSADRCLMKRTRACARGTR